MGTHCSGMDVSASDLLDRAALKRLSCALHSVGSLLQRAGQRDTSIIARRLANELAILALR